MDVPQLTPNARADNLTARLVAIIIHEMTICISRWREYAASKDAQLQQLYRENQQDKARIEAQCQTIHAQDERIRRLELEMFPMEMSPMELSCGTVSPAAFSMSLQGSETPNSVVDLQAGLVDETFGDALKETYGRASDDGNASIRDDVFAPLLALAMTAAEDTTGRAAEARESPQTESKSPMKRRMEEEDAASKRVRHT
ncbi:uncharacterized protein ColSpa_11904 [Colletotrichum spaethianum]|uniref:Uncharacterized protein n=1 Tax=Colletotrichum spaethianum TaxID=700344 RepID=A0AA37UTD8_9PEZI|nr:uncharacterized protein ColSpa_11904 [Colletotrichum spaethianum]GKT51723.1 hypothetical protein ColSpa_11904 [Colletotrichum spaethianum]